MKTAEIKKMFVENRDDLGHLMSLRIASPYAEAVIIIDDPEMAKAALRAGVDYLRHGEYDHPWTEVGLHIRAEYTNLNRIPYAENIGVVDLRTYGGDRFDYMGESGKTLKINQLHPDMNWYQLNWSKGKFFLKHINPRRVNTANDRNNMKLARQRSMKHDCIDMLIGGAIIDARTLLFAVNKDDPNKPSYTDCILATIYETDDEKSRQMKLDAYYEVQDNWANSRPVVEARQNGTIKSASERASVLQIKVSGMPDVTTVAKLPFGRYNVLRGNKIVGSINWQGRPEQAIQIAETARRNRELSPDYR